MLTYTVNQIIWAATCQNQQNECAYSEDSDQPVHAVWSESSLCAQWVAKGPRFLHADSEDSGQTGRMPRLIWVLAGRTVTLLVLSCRGSFSIWESLVWQKWFGNTCFVKLVALPGRLHFNVETSSKIKRIDPKVLWQSLYQSLQLLQIEHSFWGSAVAQW